MTNETGQTRRIVLGGLAASAGLLSMIDEMTAQAQTSGKTFMLVHGAWHGGWCWRRVSDLLEKKGQKVFRPTMRGSASARTCSMPRINLAHSRHRHRQRDQVGEPSTTSCWVGHSYGGAVVSRRRRAGGRRRSAVSCSSMCSRRRTARAWASLTTRFLRPSKELVQKGETSMKPVPAAVFQVNENDLRLGRRHVHAASARDLHRQDRLLTGSR